MDSKTGNKMGGQANLPQAADIVASIYVWHARAKPDRFPG